MNKLIIAAFSLSLSSCVVETQRRTSLVAVPEAQDPDALSFPPKIVSGYPPGKWIDPENEVVETTSNNPYAKPAPVRKSELTVRFSTMFEKEWHQRVYSDRNTEGYQRDGYQPQIQSYK